MTTSLKEHPATVLAWLSACAALLAGGGCAVCEMGNGAEEVRRVESFDLSGATCGLGKRVQKGMSVDGNPLTVGGKAYAHGFGTRPESAVLFRANGKVAACDKAREDAPCRLPEVRVASFA